MELLYIFSISFQIAGAVLLIISALSIKREDVIKKFINKTIISLESNTGEVIYDKTEFKNTFKQAYLTGFSFSYICLGYLLGIFANIKDFNKWIILFLIIIITTILVIIAYYSTNSIIKKSSNINKEITIDELKELGLEVNIENISNDEIDKICN